MALSTKTKKVIARRSITPQQDFYPDMSATDLSIKGDPVLRLPFDDVARTTQDMSTMFKWKYGDPEVKGAAAKAHSGGKSYRRDIEKAVGEKGKYKEFFVNTFKPIGEQLANK